MIKTWEERFDPLPIILKSSDAQMDAMQAEIDELRAELDRLKKQEPHTYIDDKGDTIDKDDVAWFHEEHYTAIPLYLTAGAQPDAKELEELRADTDRFKQALEKINVVRDDIIRTQSINWSRHIYPLVAALDEVGVGCEIDAARAAS